jgi:hypothetical protein
LYTLANVILEVSALWYSSLVESNALVVNCEIDFHAYNKLYYLADGIYPDRSTIVKAICNPEEEKYQRFAKKTLQKGCEVVI